MSWRYVSRCRISEKRARNANTITMTNNVLQITTARTVAKWKANFCDKAKCWEQIPRNRHCANQGATVCIQNIDQIIFNYYFIYSSEKRKISSFIITWKAISRVNTNSTWIIFDCGCIDIISSSSFVYSYSVILQSGFKCIECYSWLLDDNNVINALCEP